MERRTKKIVYDNENITPAGKAIGANNDKPIKKTKTVETPNKIKTIEYGKMGSYGKQEKTRTVIRKKPSIIDRLKDYL